MKTLATILTIVVVISLNASSPSLASPSSRIHSFQSIMAFIYQYVAPYSFGVFSPIEIQPIGSGSGASLRGDADDAANGRDNDTEEEKGCDNRINAGLPGDDPGASPLYTKSTFGRR